jgi:cytochrome b involved in lipid metabolism
MSKNSRIYTWKEIQQHCVLNDCWLVVNNKVYDVTLFINHHPGGGESIMKHAGMDVTTDYEFHSIEAKKHWKEFEIGVVQTDKQSKCINM